MSFGSSSLPAPTKAESLRMDLIVQAGCIAHWQLGKVCACEVHHLTVGGKHGAPRLGHAFTVGLCSWHHRGVGPLPARVMEAEIGPSYARNPRAFRQQFGDDSALLRIQRVRILAVVRSYLIPPGEFACPVG